MGNNEGDGKVIQFPDKREPGLDTPEQPEIMRDPFKDFAVHMDGLLRNYYHEHESAWDEREAIQKYRRLEQYTYLLLMSLQVFSHIGADLKMNGAVDGRKIDFDENAFHLERVADVRELADIPSRPNELNYLLLFSIPDDPHDAILFPEIVMIDKIEYKSDDQWEMGVTSIINEENFRRIMERNADRPQRNRVLSVGNDTAFMDNNLAVVLTVTRPGSKEPTDNESANIPEWLTKAAA